MNDDHAVTVQQRVELRSHGGEATGLDLDECSTAHDVDDEAAHRHLELVAGLRQPVFEGRM